MDKELGTSKKKREARAANTRGDEERRQLEEKKRKQIIYSSVENGNSKRVPVVAPNVDAWKLARGSSACMQCEGNAAANSRIRWEWQ